jgi:hypothetical protein
MPILYPQSAVSEQAGHALGPTVNGCMLRAEDFAAWSGVFTPARQFRGYRRGDRKVMLNAASHPKTAREHSP